MATKKKSRKPAPRKPQCVCVVMHTYEAYVTDDAWDVSVHTCVICGVEHLQEPIPLPGTDEAPTDEK